MLIDDPGPLDKFSHVCSPADIEQYPKDQPTSSIRPFFRKTYCDLTFDGVDELERVWNTIESDVLMVTRNTLAHSNITSSMEVSA
jgi:hypothetical protein